MGNTPSTNKTLPTSPRSTNQPLLACPSSTKPIKKQFRELNLNNIDKVKKLIKKNSHAITKSRIHLSDPISLLSRRQYFDNLRHNQPPPEIKLLFQKEARQTAQMLRGQKAILNLHYAFSAPSSSTMSFLISKLKGLHHISSLTLDLSSVKSLTPQHLKSLSLILGNFKKLASLNIIFPSSVEMTPEHITSLGLAFHRLRALTDLSFKVCHRLGLGFSSLKPFAKLLSKLTKLQSLSLSQFASMTPLALSFLPPVLKKLTSLENVYLDLADMGRFQSKFLNQVFLALKDKKKPCKNLALNFKDCAVDFPNSDPISQGLAMLDLSKLQSFKLLFYPNKTSKNLQQLIATLQASPLKRLSLDLSEGRFSHNSIQFSLNLQSLQYLSDLSLNPSKLVNGIEAVGTVIKPLLNLKSLDINFSGQTTLKDFNNELINFSFGLKGLKNLKHFSFNLRNLAQIKTEGLKAVSAGLQYLTGLSSLNLGLAKMEISKFKRLSGLCATLAKLTKLIDLSLDFSENEDFDQRDLDNLAGTFISLSSLRSVNLNFNGCVSLGQKRDSFKQLFKSLGQLKLLAQITLEIPCIIENMSFRDYEAEIKHVEDQNIQRKLVRTWSR